MIMIMLGYVIQTFGEYFIHRYIFHGILWKMHQVHHKYPHKKKHLITPLLFSLFMAFITYNIYKLILPINILYSTLLGNYIAYINFEYIHYLSHTTSKIFFINKLKNSSYIKYLIVKHKIHHFKINNEYKNYGFTTMIWDKLYSTLN